MNVACVYPVLDLELMYWSREILVCEPLCLSLGTVIFCSSSANCVPGTCLPSWFLQSWADQINAVTDIVTAAVVDSWRCRYTVKGVEFGRVRSFFSARFCRRGC